MNSSTDTDYIQNASNDIFINNILPLPVIAIAYLLQFLFCCCGNVLVFVLLPSLQESSDYITLSLRALAFSDLLHGLLSMPINFILSISKNWFLGEFLCKMLMLIISGNCLSGIWLVAYISYDRYLKICHPFQDSKLRQKRVCIVVITIICLVSLLTFISNIYFYTIEYYSQCECIKCIDTMPNKIFAYSSIVKLLLLYLIPLFISFFFNTFILQLFLSFMSYQNLMRTSHFTHVSTIISSMDLLTFKFLKTSTICFTLTNIPTILLKILIILKSFNVNKQFLNIETLAYYALFTSTMTSAINPWLYFLYSNDYRSEFLYKIGWQIDLNRLYVKNQKKSSLFPKVEAEHKTSLYNNDSSAPD